MEVGAKKIFVTGCSTGIGLDTALYLKEKGYEVIASVRKDKDVKLLEEAGLECLVLDLLNEDNIVEVVEYLNEKHPDLYGLVNNGAYGQPGAVEDLSREALREQFEVNVFGTHSLTMRLVPLFRKVGRGRIIQISSVLGFVSLPMRGAYNSSKHALEGLTDTMRMELLGSGIDVVLIEPGPIESDFRKNAYLAFEKWIDAESSEHKSTYENVYGRLNSSEKAKFTLPARSVSTKIEKALSAKCPKVRYRITFPTHLMWLLKRVASSRWMDGFLRRQGG